MFNYLLAMRYVKKIDRRYDNAGLLYDKRGRNAPAFGTERFEHTVNILTFFIVQIRQHGRHKESLMSST